jgi:disulfide bond formation protein DsbB
MVDSVVYALSTLTVFGQALIILIGVSLIMENMGKSNALTSWIANRGLVLMFIVALVSTFGSLFLSEIAGWTPCSDCWYQRIFMYPQVLLLSIALWKKDRSVAVYLLALSVIGAVIAAHHYSEQVEAALTPADPLKPCDLSGVSCAKTPFFRFGYITIPMMAFTAFVLNALGSIIVMKKKN